MISAILGFALGILLCVFSLMIFYLGMQADPKHGMTYIASGMMTKMVLGSAMSVGFALYVPDFQVAPFALALAPMLGIGIPAVAVYVTRKKD